MTTYSYFRLDNGRGVADQDFDETLFYLIGGARALTGPMDAGGQKITNLGTPTDDSDMATKGYVDNLVQGIDWQESVQYNINYVKAGAPINTGATNGERCLDTTNKKLYTFTGGAWDAGVACVTNDRYIFKDDGDDTSGDAGTYTHDNKIRQYNGTTIDEYSPGDYWTCAIEDEGVIYTFNGTNWVKFASISTHNTLSGLQGGTSAQYYHLTQNEHDAASGATTPSSGNTFLTHLDRDKVPSRLTFAYKAFPKNTTDAEFYEAAGNFQRILMPSNGSIVKSTLQCSGPRTAGSLTAEPTIDGTKVTPGDLDLVLDGTTTNDDKAEVAPGTTGLTFTAGQKLGVKVTSTVDWAPDKANIQFEMYVVFDS